MSESSDRRRRTTRSGGGEEDGGRKGGGSRPKKHKEKLCEESGQTQGERQRLRARQLEIKRHVIEQRGDIADPTKNNMVDVTLQASELFTQVKFTREAVTDGETLRLISESASGQVKKVTQGSSGLDVDKFLSSIQERYTSSGDDGSSADDFNWSLLGSAVAQVYWSVPQGGGFMLGPLDKPAKGPRAQNRKRDRPTDDDAEEVRPESQAPKVGKTNKTGKDDTEKRIFRMRSHCKAKDKLNKQQDMFETLFNPDSFTQTVENIFDFSFFIKSGEGAISMDEKTQLPQVTFTEGRSGNENTTAKQWLMTMTPAQFREIVELYEMEQSNIRHRDEGKKSKYYDPLVEGEFRDEDKM